MQEYGKIREKRGKPDQMVWSIYDRNLRRERVKGKKMLVAISFVFK